MSIKSDPNAFTLSVRPSNAAALREAIEHAFAADGTALPANLIVYEGPPPGAFGADEGWLGFASDAWSQLMKLPKAVQILAQGIADFATKTRISVRVRVDETIITISAAASADVSKIVAELTSALAHRKRP
jgi:hypothetical protein